MVGAEIDFVQLLIEYVPAAIAIFDRNMHYIAVSRRFAADYHIAGEQLIGRSHYDVFPEIPDRWKEIHRRCLDGAVERADEDPFPRADGTLDWVRWEIRPWIDGSGEIGGIVLFSEVITERHQAADALQASEVRHRQIASLTSDYVYSSVVLPDGTGVTEWIDGAFEQITGYSVDQLSDLPGEFADLILLEDRTQLLSLLPSAQAGEGHIAEYRIRRKDGEIRWLRDYMRFTTDAPHGMIRVLGAVQDITERKRAEALIYAQRDLARALSKAASGAEGWQLCLDVALGISDMDCGGIYLFDATGRFLELVHHAGLGPDIVSRVERYVADATVEEAILADRAIYITGNETEQHVRFRSEGLKAIVSVPILHQGQTIGRLNVGSHTLDEVPGHARQALETIAAEIGNFAVYLRTELSLRESEEKYRTLVEASDAAIAMVDLGGRIRYANEKAAAAAGMSASALVGRTVGEIDPGARAEAQLAQVRRVIADDQGEVDEIVVGGAWYRSSVQPVHDANGKAVMALMSATDITALKRAQQELVELNHTLEARIQQRTTEVQDLYENAPAGYHSLDAHGAFVRINQTELNWLGYTRDEIVGRRITDFLPPGQATKFLELFALLKERGALRDVEFDLIRRDGSILPLLLNTMAVYDGAGNFVMSRATVFDNTERKKAEATVRMAAGEMERAMRLKDEFLASMSHELRTPLNGILTLSEVLLEGAYGPISERQQQPLRDIEASGRHLLTLINDLLDLSKIEAGKLELDLEPVLLDDVCQASLLFVKQVAQKKKIQLSYYNERLHTGILADPRRLKQMLVNLLSNAVKFTPDGGQVRLSVTMNAGAEQIELAVEDTGMGISPASQAKLFQPFTQLDSALSREFEGTGLGLALVKRLAEEHGGTVRVESEGIAGKGSCFTIVLPAALVDETELSPALDPARTVATADTAKSPVKTRILLAEDNEANITTVNLYLDHLGYRVIVARTGPEALARALDAQPDLILMDIQLPQMDGLEVMRRLRHSPHLATTPIIAVTALAMRGDRERCLAAGATEYMSKPLRLKELAALIERLLAE